jgi:4-amino-4-deoxy-L-arabinose transferase-like glycosyltransferase
VESIESQAAGLAGLGPGTRSGERLRSLRFVEVLALASIVAFYLATTLPNIGNNPIAGGDEGWIISGSAKLAEHGTFGTDLFAGFFKADSRYYFNLPLQHLVLAGVFKVFGTGITQARLVSAAFGLLALALTYALGRRVGGRGVGVGAAALLVLLRLNLTPFTGLTLTDLGATVRYDLIALPFALAAALVLLRRPEAPSVRDAALAGVLLGLGCLTQFIDALFVLPFALFILGAPLASKRKALLYAVLTGAVLLPFLPYFAYALTDWHDFRAQGHTNLQKTDVLSPSFYLDNLRHEPDRYNLGLEIGDAGVLKRPSARLALLVLAPLAAAYAVVRARGGSAPHRLLALTLLALVVELALFESTKRFVYWVVVAPFLCVAIADGAMVLWRWQPQSERLRRVVLAGAAACAVVIAAEGAIVGARNLRDAGDAPSLAEAGEAVREVVPEGSMVLTDNRMWPALRDMQPRSLLLLFYWTNPDIAGEELTDIPGAIERTNARYLLLSPVSKELLTHLSPEDSATFASYLKQHGTLKAVVAEPPYGPIEVYELRP